MEHDYRSSVPHLQIYHYGATALAATCFDCTFASLVFELLSNEGPGVSESYDFMKFSYVSAHLLHITKCSCVRLLCFVHFGLV